jgi:hypothetical protein
MPLAAAPEPEVGRAAPGPRGALQQGAEAAQPAEEGAAPGARAGGGEVHPLHPAPAVQCSVLGPCLCSAPGGGTTSHHSRGAPGHEGQQAASSFPSSSFSLSSFGIITSPAGPSRLCPWPWPYTQQPTGLYRELIWAACSVYTVQSGLHSGSSG